MPVDPAERAEQLEAPGAPAKSNGHAAVTLDAIRNAKDLVESQDVEIPEWGVTVKVRGLTRGELRKIGAGTGNDVDGELMNARAMALAMIEPRVTEAEALEILDSKGMKATGRITDAIMEASGMAPGFREGEEAAVRA